MAKALCGLIVVDKPVGLSSMDVVRRVRRAASQGAGQRRVKTGHAGTLDPLATGVVVCCLGSATRCVEQLMGLVKVYDAQIDLSAYTCTDDREGPREPVVVNTAPKRDVIDRTCATFVGKIEQIPPRYSAVHIGGQRAYQLARKGQRVAIAPRVVRIDAIMVLGYEWPLLDLHITCGRGTYIRSLARDLGVALGTGGHLASLCRTAVGPYTIDQAQPIKRFEVPITAVDLLPVPV